MGHTQSAQHSFHHQHQHHRAYRPHGPSPGGSAGDGSSETDDVPRWNTHSFPRDPRRARALRNGQGGGGGGHTQLAPENKVLPKVIGPPPKLRTTDNGNILHNGGTISGRKISQTQLVAPVKAYRARHEVIPNNAGGRGGPGLTSSRARFGGSEPDLRAPGQRPAPVPSNNNAREPNNRPGRTTTAAAAAAAAAARKKYKAPPPPQGGAPQDSESPSDTTWEEGGSALPRRARLFKTRTQTNGSPATGGSTSTNGGRPGGRSPREDEVPRAALNPAAANFLAQKSVSSPEFQHELVRAAQRRHRERAAKQQTQPHQQQKPKQTPPQPQNKGSSPVPSGPRHAPVGRESSSEHKEIERPTRSRSPVSESEIKRTPPKLAPVKAPSPAAPPKTFYFGMDVGSGAQDEDEVDRFAARLRRPDRVSARPSSGSGGSFFEDEQIQNEGDISLQLRPTLPKKTPDIPRFSPTAAWRQLLVGGDPLGRDAAEDSEEEIGGHRVRHRHRSSSPIIRESGGTTALLEERIVQSYLQRAPLVVAARGSVATQEKSGDSGISGDASPGPGATLLDSPDSAPLPHPRSRKHHAAVAAVRQWTPEQDLDETSSEDEHTRPPPARSPQTRRSISEERPGETAFKGERGRSSGRVTPPKFIRRSHMFSLSLPRPDHLQYVATKGYDDLESPLDSPTGADNGTTFHSLKKLRRSVSGALGAALGGSNNLRAQQLSLDENWYLSRSAPNSLDSSGEGGGGVWGPRALRHVPDDNGEAPSSPDCDGEDEAEEEEELSSGLKTPAFSYLASGGHIMYLPEYDSRRCIVPRVKSNQLTAAQRSLSVDVLNFHKKQELNSSFTPINYNDNNNGIQEMKEKRPESPWSDTQQHQQIYYQQKSSIPISLASKSTPVASKKGKKFTFQSTIRQIERRRIADRLSKEAEQQEKQRKHEAEAMRLVEEEFQRKRAREKASLKEQLRLFSLQDGSDGPHSLPVMSSDLEPRAPQRRTRAEPEGAASARVISVHSKRSSNHKQEHDDDIARARAEPREYRDYTASPAKISSRYPSGERSTPPPSSPSSGRGSNGGARRNVLHPPAVYDMPKSTQVYVAPHPNITVPGPVFVDSEAPGGVPRSPDQHNYRREFARGAVQGGGMSPKSPRVPRAKLSPSPSPLEQDSGASRGHSNNFSSLPPQQLMTSSTPAPQLTRLSALQPFGVTRAKGYRPIAFKPPGGATGSGNKGAKLAQAVS